MRDFQELVEKFGDNLYEVGGCVRDYLMGIPHKDCDYVIEAFPCLHV